MSQPPPEYEQLTPEDAARVDAACDRFERAWKGVPAGTTPPCVTDHLDQLGEPARTALMRELVALDHACRQRYGVPVRPEEYLELGRTAVIPANPDQSPAAAVGPVGPDSTWPRIPGLEFLELLGYGGMGVVYKARQAALDRVVAVKLSRDSHPAGPDHRERFFQEARAVARLQHPHLVQVYDFGELPGTFGSAPRPYLVLEYVAGGSLADRLHGPPLPPTEVARLVEALAEAVHYAHGQGVVHRDLKPANVLLAGVRGQGSGVREDKVARSSLTPDPWPLTPKITDFGLAKFVAGSDLTQTGDVIGTPCYMAPEQTTGGPGAVSGAVDVYGLGAILYEALTGRPPFLAGTVEATLLQVKQADPVPPRRLRPDVPRDLETICLKCLRKEPGRRYATAQDLADDLRRFRSGEPIRARPVGSGERAVRWCRRQPALAAALAAVAVVFLVGLAGILWQWQSARHHAAAAEQNALDFRRERDAALREQGRAEFHLGLARKRVDRLTQVGQDLCQRPRLHGLGKELLAEALDYYEQVIPREGSDPRLRREAARLYSLVAHIHHTLGSWAKAIEAYRQEARLLAGLVDEAPTDKPLRHTLALSHRWRGNALRDLGRAREAREAYKQAAEIHDQLLHEEPGDARCQVALANTLLNLTSVLSRRDDAVELERLYGHMLALNWAAVKAAPGKEWYREELALALESRGMYLLDSGQVAPAEKALREALKIRRELLATGRMGRGHERYVALNHANLGRFLAGAGRRPEAEESYRAAVALLEPLMTDFPDTPFYRANLAETLGSLADLLTDPARRGEVEQLRRQVLRQYEILTADFREDPANRRHLARSHVLLGIVLCEGGRWSEGADQFRRALKVDPASTWALNELAWLLATAPEPALRDTSEAVRLAERAVADEPKSGNYRNTLGVARYRQGDDKGAVADLEASMRLRNGGDSWDWFFLAMAHWRMGNHDAARCWLGRAVTWQEQHSPLDEQLRRFRAEAESLLAEAGRP